MSNRVPVIVVSGFLGSGKTTFLRYLLNSSNKKYGFLINEFGDIGIDGDLLQSCQNCSEDSKACVIELNNGCLCCTVQDDFVPSIKKLIEFNSDLDGIIIEASGLALPIPLLKALNWPEIRPLVYLDFVIGIINGESMLYGYPINDLNEINKQFDATEIIEHKTSIDELFHEQLKASDIVLISRGDILTDDQFKKVKCKINEKINSNILILKSNNGRVDLNFLFDLDSSHKNLSKEIHVQNHDQEHSHPELYSQLYRSDYFLDKRQFDKEIIEILKDLELLRVKGRMWIPQKKLPLQIQIVGKKLNTWFEEAPKDCWKPMSDGGIELIMIGFKKEYFELFIKKIKDKFNILSEQKSYK